MINLKNNCPLLSVIIPVFNAEFYLEKCIYSILNQTFIDFELIIIDNDSKDRSYEISKQFSTKDKRIRILKCLEKGCSPTRNLGIKQSRGKYITFVDSDDFIEPRHFNNFFTFAKDYNLIVQGIKRVDLFGKEI